MICLFFIPNQPFEECLKTIKPSVLEGFEWWSIADSNRSPRHCQWSKKLFVTNYETVTYAILLNPQKIALVNLHLILVL